MYSFKSIAFFCFALIAFATHAQEGQKIGYADWDYIFGAMPEFKQIDTQLKAHGDQLQTQVQAKSKEIEDKLKVYQALPSYHRPADPRRQAKGIAAPGCGLEAIQ
jgi:outer membrane protein